jgi:hypothetical protein
MDPARLVEIEYRISHQHRDGSSSPMVEETSHHDAAAHDPERRWGIRRIFRCAECDETITIERDTGDEGGPLERAR